MKPRTWLWLAGAALVLLTARKVEAGACISARFHDWQDGGCNQNFAGVGGANSGQSGAGGNNAHCTGCPGSSSPGMPRWWVSEPYESLCISDKPLSYTTSSGQEMSFQLYYRQRYQLPGVDEVPNFYTVCGPSATGTRLANDAYAAYSRIGGITNAAWGNNWMMDIIFWSIESETPFSCTVPAPGTMYALGYEALVFRPEGEVQYFRYASSLQDARSQAKLVPLSGLTYPTVSSQTHDANGIYWGNATNGFRLVYPDGSQDIFGFTPYAPYLVGASTRRALLTQKSDPQGRITQLGYQYSTNGPLLGYRVRYVVDPDGRTNTFLYATINCNLFYDQPTPNPWQLTEVDDPYGRKVQLGYAVQLDSPLKLDYGLLTSITDAAGLTSSFQYQAAIVTNKYYLGNCSAATGTTNIVGLQTNSSGWITNLTTPYGNTSFGFYQVTDPDPTVPNGYQQRAVYVSEPDGAQQLFVYEHTNWLIAPSATSPTNIPGQSFDDGTPPGSTGHYTLNYRNTFHWGRRQFAALPGATQTLLSSGSLSNAILNLSSNDYNKADLKHWLVGADAVSITEALSSEQDPSPDAAGLIPGARTWYNYRGQSAELFGYSPQVNCIARLLPDGSSQYITYHFYPMSYACGGLVSDNESSYSQTDGTIGVLTNLFQYAANGIDLTNVSNSAGQCWHYAYNGNHEVTFATNALNQVTGLTWDTTTLNLSQVTLPSGQTTALSYYATAQPPGNTGSLLESITLQPQGLTVQIADYTNGLPRVVTTSGTGLPSLTVTNFWDGLNRLTGALFPDGTTTSNRYDRLYVGAIKDRLGHWTSYGYDGLEHITTTTDALTNITTLAWCDCGSLSSITDPLTNKSFFNYNNQGLLTIVTNADNSSVTYGLDSIGRVTSAADGLGKALTFGYNNQGLVTVVSNAFGCLESIVYDAVGRPIQVTDANNVTVTNQFDLLNHLTARFWPDGIGEGFGWSPNGLIAYTNRDQKVTQFARDGAGRLAYATNANMEVTQLGYNALDEVTDLWDGRTNHTVWNYNQYGWLMSKTNTLSQAVMVYTRDPNGQVTNRWTPQFGNTGYILDQVGNLKQINYPQSSVAFAYNALNELKTMVDAVGTENFTWTPTGNLQSETTPWSNDTVSYGYTEGLRTSLSINNPLSTINYSYDSAWRLSTLTSPAGTFNYGYDAQRSTLPTTLALPSYASITNHYDSLARLDYTALVNYWGHVLDGYSYGMDPLGLRTNITRNLGLTTNTVGVGFDNIGQITSWSAKEGLSGPLRLNEQYNYVYDKAGNLWLRTNGSLAQTFSCDALNQLTNVTRNNAITVSGATPAPAASVTVNGHAAQTYGDLTFAATNLSLAGGTNTFTIIATNIYAVRKTNIVTANLPASVVLQWDANGNLTNDGSFSFAYGPENQLTNITAAGAWKSDFVFDGLGRRRVEKDYGWQGGNWTKTNELHFVYDGWLLVQVRDGSNNVLVTYTRGLDLSGSLTGAGGIGGLLARTDGNGSTFYHADGSGNITGLMDGQQNMAERLMFDPFGKPINQQGAMAGVDIMGFSSMPVHGLSGLVHFHGREYDTIPRRWIQRDPIGEAGGINLYGFVGNNPISNVDPLGLDNFKGPNNAPPALTLSAPVGGGQVSSSYPSPLGDPFFIIGAMTLGGMAAGGTAQASTASLGIEQTILLGAMIANDLQTRQKQKHCPPKTDPSNQPTIGMAKKPDIKFIDYLQKKHNLSDSLRERLHEEITGQNLSKTEIEAIVKSLVEELPKRLPPIE